MIVSSAVIVVIAYIFNWNDHTYINSYCQIITANGHCTFIKLALLLKYHYNVLLHTFFINT